MDNLKNDLVAFGLFMAMILALIFIPAHFREKADYKERVEGILVNTRPSTRGSLYLYLYKDENKQIEKLHSKLGMKHNVNLNIGDSIIKKSYSWYIQIYRNSVNGYQFVDSINIGRW